MSILAAIRREQKKARKKLAKLQHQLSGLEAAAQANPALVQILRSGEQTQFAPGGLENFQIVIRPAGVGSNLPLILFQASEHCAQEPISVK